MKKFFAGLLCVLCLGCSQKEPSLDGSYVLMQAPEDAEITLEIRGNRFSGQSAVNNYFGDLTQKDGTFKLNVAGVTMMAGPENLLIVEQNYLQDLQAVSRYTIDGQKLILSNDSDKTMVFEKK
jgi:heat shock protein HslJ